MEMALVDAGWAVERILPYDDLRWIAEAWLPLVRNLIVSGAGERSQIAVRSGG
jgi:hypothetical protein